MKIKDRSNKVFVVTYIIMMLPLAFYAIGGDIGSLFCFMALFFNVLTHIEFY